jgi:hypothetical protein
MPRAAALVACGRPGRERRKYSESVLSPERNLQEYAEFLYGLVDGETQGSRPLNARASRHAE